MVVSSTQRQLAAEMPAYFMASHHPVQQRGILRYSTTPFAGFAEDSAISEIYLNGRSGNEVRNNLFWDTVGSINITANSSSNNVDETSDPFVDYANRDFRLSASDCPGSILSSPYEY